jgi:hypothetical protein
MTWGYFCRICLRTFEHGDLIQVVLVNGKEAFVHVHCEQIVKEES